jgi:replicative DNA helicase
LASKYEDSTSAIQVIGGIINQPELLEDTGKYFFRAEDFTSELHRVVFSAIGTIYANGGTKVTAKAVDDVLSTYPEAYATYKASRGNEWFAKVQAECDLDNFDLYYNRLKKMTLLREYDNAGIDVSSILDMDELDAKKRQKQWQEFDNMSANDIADDIENKMSKIKSTFVDNLDKNTKLVSDGLSTLFSKLRNEPEFGVPLYGPFINTVTMGARLTKFYLRSAPTGVGKTRMMIADVCNIACDEIYDPRIGAWKKNGESLPCLYISTELEMSEIQTMCLAFLSNVEENKILGAEKMTFDEIDRVEHALEVLERAPLFIDIICDFSLKDIENSIRKNHRENKVMYVFYDYIMTTMKILEEITAKSKGVNLREDSILFMISVKLKDLANELGIFVLTSTQLNGRLSTAN